MNGHLADLDLFPVEADSNGTSTSANPHPQCKQASQTYKVYAFSWQFVSQREAKAARSPPHPVRTVAFGHG
jgi:hypothetical protein